MDGIFCLQLFAESPVQISLVFFFPIRITSYFRNGMSGHHSGPGTVSLHRRELEASFSHGGCLIIKIDFFTLNSVWTYSY